jgi:phasin family protein
MPREQSQERQGQMEQMGPLFFPFQQFGSMFCENFEQLTDFQLDLARSYTHFAMSQWRDALEIHDPQSLRQYFEKQGQATEELTRKVVESAERVMQASEQTTRRGLHLVQSGADIATSTMQRSVEQAQSIAEQASRQAQEPQQRQEGRQQESQRRQPQPAGGLPIENYDELTTDEIEQRLEQMDQNQIRQLSEYERQHKNRKTLNDAFQRRL